MKHYTEVELLEQYYLGNVSAGLADHVNSCQECMARFKRLSEKLSCPAEAHREHVDAKPASFWSKQRADIRTRMHTATSPASRGWPVAAAIVLALVAGTFLFTTRDDVPAVQQVAQPQTFPQEVMVALEDDPASPWESEELEAYSDLVEWESWLAETPAEGAS